MVKVIAILLFGLLFEAVGVVCLSAGMKELRRAAAAETGSRMRPATLLRLAKAGITNRNLVLGVACETVFFTVLCLLLAQRDVSLVWPLSALSFVLTGLVARFFLHEQVSPLRWAGILLIVAGAVLITWSEKDREREGEQPAASSGPPSVRRHA
jgi:drug/metabolite transporter (DMT)-like permease